MHIRGLRPLYKTFVFGPWLWGWICGQLIIAVVLPFKGHFNGVCLSCGIQTGNCRQYMYTFGFLPLVHSFSASGVNFLRLLLYSSGCLSRRCSQYALTSVDWTGATFPWAPYEPVFRLNKGFWGNSLISSLRRSFVSERHCSWTRGDTRHIPPLFLFETAVVPFKDDRPHLSAWR